MTVEDILRRFWRPEGEGGSDGDEQELLDALEEHCRRRRRQNGATMILVTLLLVGVIGALAHELTAGDGKLLPVIGAAGLGVPALMTLLIASMTDLSKTDLLLRIARRSDAPTIKGMIDKALGK